MLAGAGRKIMIYAPFDTETGGTNAEETDVLTFYMALLDENFKMLDEIDLKLKPDGGRLPVTHAKALEVNGIDIRKHLEDPETITYSEGRERFAAMLKKHHKREGRYNNIKPMGYNVPFDERYVWKHIMPFGQWEEFMHYKRIDVMERVDFLKESGWFPPELGGLGTVNEYLRLPKRNAHNAKDDTWMCVDVYVKIIDIMKSKKDNVAATQDLISLLEA
jgi:DNA polymerase III epsilon subunit-like protein